VRRPHISRLPLWVWAAWAAAVLLSFAGLETYTLLTAADGDTLSEATRLVLGIDPVQPWRIAGMVGFSAVLLGFVAWFLPHVLFRVAWWNPFKRRNDAAYPPVETPKTSQVNDSPNPTQEAL
jgi:hypothetical protein